MKTAVRLCILFSCSFPYLMAQGLKEAPWLAEKAGAWGISKETSYTQSLPPPEAGVPKTVLVHPYHGISGEYVPEGRAFQVFLSARVKPTGFHDPLTQGPNGMHRLLATSPNRPIAFFVVNIQNNPFASVGGPVTKEMHLPKGAKCLGRVSDEYTLRALKPQYMMSKPGTERQEPVECWVHAVDKSGTIVAQQHFPPMPVILHKKGNASGNTHHIKGISRPDETFVVYWRVDYLGAPVQSFYGVNLLLGNTDCDQIRRTFPHMNFGQMSFKEIWHRCVGLSSLQGTRTATQLFSILGME
ncbi:MAG: hypothetical protein LBF76_02065 [Holosporales bacterium]|nr:hypothetical protein [Holosporales bacterium]